MRWFIRQGLTTQILICMVLGFIVGFFLNHVDPNNGLRTFLVDGVFTIGGKIFVKSLKMIVVPLVFTSLVCGVTSLSDIKQMGRIGGRTMVFYLGTTCVAISFAILFAAIMKPGVGFDLPTSAAFEGKEAPPLVETIINIFPDNPVESMANGSMLQIIVFSILFGMAITMSGEKGKRINGLFDELNEIILELVKILMAIAPIGVFCLIANVFAGLGLDAIRPLTAYFFTLLGVLFVHGLVTYPALLTIFGRLNPTVFLRKFREVWVYAFSTASSNATLPVTLEVVEEKLGVDNSVGSFTIPLGATINMDGTAIMQGVATMFIAQAYGIELSFSDLLSVVATATLASIGTAGVPGVGLIMLAMVLRQVNLPVEGIGLIIGVDRLLDMVRTAVNVTGDAAVSCIVAKKEGKLDESIYNS